MIYASLSEAVARYLRSRDILTLTWIDDFRSTNFGSTRLLEAEEPFQAASVAAYVVLEVFFSAGYFISLPKCEIESTTRLVFLGIICDSVACRFEAPEDKLEKLEAILTEAVTSGVTTFRMLECWRSLRESVLACRWRSSSSFIHAPHVPTDRNFSANGGTQEEHRD